MIDSSHRLARIARKGWRLSASHAQADAKSLDVDAVLHRSRQRAVAAWFMLQWNHADGYASYRYTLAPSYAAVRRRPRRGDRTCSGGRCGADDRDWLRSGIVARGRRAG